MLHQTIEKLHALKLSAMADALLGQSRQPGIEALGFEERLALLVDVQHTAAYNAALGQRLKAANLRQTACLEDLDLRTPRGLDRTLVATLASGQWIRTSQSVLLTGPTGVGKTFIACALGHQAARDGFSVLYRRLPRLLDDLRSPGGGGPAPIGLRQAGAHPTVDHRLMCSKKLCEVAAPGIERCGLCLALFPGVLHITSLSPHRCRSQPVRSTPWKAKAPPLGGASTSGKTWARAWRFTSRSARA